jgi:hypothetical protein
MMRRKNTSRRVHALSSDSIRSDEIAATDIELSRDCSREGTSDIGDVGDDWEIGFHRRFMASRHGKINPANARA